MEYRPVKANKNRRFQSFGAVLVVTTVDQTRPVFVVTQGGYAI